MMQKTVRKYTTDFKIKVVRYAEKHTSPQAAAYFNIAQTNIKRWRRIHGACISDIPYSAEFVRTECKKTRSKVKKKKKLGIENIVIDTYDFNCNDESTDSLGGR